jgi:hypothetical protein
MTIDMSVAFGVKVLLPGNRTWKFFDGKSGVNGLRAHAGQMSEERAKEVRDMLIAGNPGVKFKVIRF